MTEATLSDMIVKDFEVLERGLVLLSKEQYIPHSLGIKDTEVADALKYSN